MKSFTLVSGILSAALVACVVSGCSTSTSDGSSLDEQRITSKPDTAEGDSCRLPPGEYTVHQVSDPANTANCPVFQDVTTTVGADEGADDAPAGPGCTKEQDVATCTTTHHCVSDENGVTTDSTTVHTVKGSSDTGTTEFEISGPTSMKCKYTVSMTKN